MSDVPKNALEGEPHSRVNTPQAKSAMKVVAKGHMNGIDVSAAAELHQGIMQIMYELASLEWELNEVAVYWVCVGKMNEIGLLKSDRTLPLLLAALSTAGSTCEPLAQIVAAHKKLEHTPGAFSNLFKTNLVLLAPVLFGLYRRTRIQIKTTDKISGTNGAPITRPLELFNARAREVLSGESTPRAATPTPDSDDNTGHHDMEGSLEVRPTQTLSDILYILTHAPQHQEAELVKNFLDRNSFSTEQALMLSTVLNDATCINLAEVTRNPAWNFLWDVRKKLWVRDDLQSHLFSERL